MTSNTTTYLVVGHTGTDIKHTFETQSRGEALEFVLKLIYVYGDTTITYRELEKICPEPSDKPLYS